MASAPDRRLLAVVCALALAAAAAGCATSAALRAGQDAEQAQDYDRAIVEYSKVLREDPTNKDARRGLDLSRLRSSQEHFLRGRRFEAASQLEEAVVELQLAAELNPGNGDIQKLLASVRTQLRTQIAGRDGKTQLQSLVERARELTPLGLDLPSDVRMPNTLTFREASSRDVFTALGRIANVNVVFDPQFRPQPVSIDLRDARLEDALQAVSGVTRSFYRVTAQRTITIIPDTPAKRQEYEDEIVQPFFLSNADVKETLDLLRIVMDARRLAPVSANNAILIKDTPERVAAAGRIISAIDKARPEVVIDVELLEVDRTRLREYGLQIASPTNPPIGLDGSVSVPPELTLRDLRNLTQSDILLTNLPSLFYRLLKSDTNTRTLANPQLRTSEGMAAQARFGERVPVPVTIFSPIATGGVNQQPITSFNYENIGVNIDITPRTHHDDEVSLALRISVSSISGAGFGGLPTFGNREINTVIRLRDGETNLLAGLIRDDERRVMSGIPGLVDLPVVGRIFAQNRRETQETDIVLTLTPRIIRVLDLTEADLRAFRVGRDAAAVTGPLPIPLPAPVPPAALPPPEAAPEPAPAAPPTGLPAAKPILPPPPGQQ